MNKILRRYTDLPFLVDYLWTKELALLNPRNWDDKNDSFFLARYEQAKNLEATCVLCLTEAPETYHHWKVFTSGASGVCIEFEKNELLAHAARIPELVAQPVIYKSIKAVREGSPTLEELPFLKRAAFSDEAEFRLFLAKQKSATSVCRVKVPFSAVKRIYLSPWITKAVCKVVKAAIKELPDCKTLKVYRSTLVDNEDWKRLGDHAL